jgi:FemAB family protein
MLQATLDTSRRPDIVGLAATRGMTVRPLAEAEADWRTVLRAGAPHTTEYVPSLMAYFVNYNRDAHPGSHDLSMVIYHDGLPCGIWPLTLQSREDGFHCGSNMGRVLPPAFLPDLPARTGKRLARACFFTVEDLCRAAGRTHWDGRTLHDGSGIGEWYRRIMEAGAAASVAHDLWCDLSAPADVLWANVRKSYKPLISKARRLWQSEIVRAVDDARLDEVRRFHAAIAGRETRSAATWQAQGACINAGEGFAVLLRDADNRLVGAGIFHCSHATASYATGIYDRSLFKSPIGHLVQALAIEEMKARGITWYRLGRRSYSGEPSSPDAKEQSIGLFKEGFASETRLLLDTNCPVGAP